MFWLKALISVVIVFSLVPLGACDDNDTNHVQNATPSGSPVKTPIQNDESESISEEIAEGDDEITPMRIISLAPSNTETLFALGLADRVVGVTEYCNYPPEAREKDLVGGFSTVDMEKVIALDPDLVLAANYHKDELVPELERKGFNVLTIEPETLNGVLESVLQIGEATGTLEIASQLVADVRTRINAVADTVASLQADDKPGVLYVTWHDPLWTLGEGAITHELIEVAGGINIFADIEGHGQTDLETVIWRNPQVILASTGHGSAEDSPVSWVQNEDRLSNVDARISGRVYQVDSDLVTRPGPRIVDGLELIAELIHPESFAE